MRTTGSWIEPFSFSPAAQGSAFKKSEGAKRDLAFGQQGILDRGGGGGARDGGVHVLNKETRNPGGDDEMSGMQGWQVVVTVGV
jgi:hypothetical protein